jgi:hypothetical protein
MQCTPELRHAVSDNWRTLQRLSLSSYRSAVADPCECGNPRSPSPKLPETAFDRVSNRRQKTATDWLLHSREEDNGPSGGCEEIDLAEI